MCLARALRSLGGPAIIIGIVAAAAAYHWSSARHWVRDDLNLVVITLDTTRADRIGAYGYGVQTPTLDRLAREGTVFEQTSSASPLTLPAHGSLFTGRFSLAHGVQANGGFFSDVAHTTLADVLRRSGFQTGAFIGSYVLSSPSFLRDASASSAACRKWQEIDLRV